MHEGGKADLGLLINYLAALDGLAEFVLLLHILLLSQIP